MSPQQSPAHTRRAGLEAADKPQTPLSPGRRGGGHEGGACPGVLRKRLSSCSREDALGALLCAEAREGRISADHAGRGQARGRAERLGGGGRVTDERRKGSNSCRPPPWQPSPAWPLPLTLPCYATWPACPPSSHQARPLPSGVLLPLGQERSGGRARRARGPETEVSFSRSAARREAPPRRCPWPRSQSLAPCPSPSLRVGARERPARDVDPADHPEPGRGRQVLCARGRRELRGGWAASSAEPARPHPRDHR